MKRNRMVLASALLAMYPIWTQATPINFELDGVLTGSIETLPERFSACEPARICKTSATRISGIKLTLAKPSTPVTFPDVVKTPAPPAGPIPIPYPNLSRSLGITVGEFITPGGESANVLVDDIVDRADFISLSIFVESPSGYTLDSLLFTGTDATGQLVERELAIIPARVPEPGALPLLALALLGLAFRRRQATTPIE